MSDRRELARVAARGQGVLRAWTDADLAKWHRQCAAFRDDVAADKLTGGAFVVAENIDQSGLVPCVSARGNAYTLEAVIMGLCAAWARQRKAEGLPVDYDAVTELMVSALQGAGVTL